VFLDVGNKLEGRYIIEYLIWSKFVYISLNNIFALVFDCSCYNQSILSIFGHAPLPTCSYLSISLDYFYLNNCLHKRLISHILHTPASYFNNLLCGQFVLYKLIWGAYVVYISIQIPSGYFLLIKVWPHHWSQAYLLIHLFKYYHNKKALTFKPCKHV
jgi:hypothetical protein